MKRIFALIALVCFWQVGMSQTTIANQLQIVSGKGAPPATAMPSNGGLAYIDNLGIVKKSSIPGLLGKKVDSALRLNDSTIQFATINGTYNVTIRGLYDVKTKTWVDSVHAGLYKDTVQVQNRGGGQTRLAGVSAASDSLQISTLRDSTDIGFNKYTDSSVAAYLKTTGVTANTYGDPTHYPVIQVDSKGRVVSASNQSVAGSGTTNISVVATTVADSVKSSSGSTGVIPAAVAGVSAGVTTAAKQARYDSLVTVNNSGHGRPLLRAPATLDSLIARGIDMVGAGRLSVTYTGNNDSVSYAFALNNITHGIFTPSTGQTVTLVKIQRNIVNPIGTIAALTIVLPSSPSNNDEVQVKFTQAVTAITYSGGTVVGGSSGAAAGYLLTLTYDSSTTSWY